MKLNAKQLRALEEQRAMGKIRTIKRNPIFFILENIYDTYNIGGLFRLADALAIEKIYLCGETEIPPNSRIKKASIGTYKVVPWEYKKTAKESIDELCLSVIPSAAKRSRGISKIDPSTRSLHSLGRDDKGRVQIIAVEQHPKAAPYTKADYQFPLALIFGNESYGIRPETLKLVDQIVEIPMFGINKSLNVIVSAAIVSYWVMNKFEPGAGIEPAL